MVSETWPELWRDLPMAAVDVETTGFEPGENHIIEVGIVHLLNGEVTDSWGSLVKPGHAIPEKVVELTGITDKDVADAPLFTAIAEEVAARLAGRGIIAYNLPFDRSFLTLELKGAGQAWPVDNPTFDPLVLARQFHASSRSKKLGEVAARLGIELLEAHRAVDDATVAGHILYAFGDQLPTRLHDLLVLQAQWERQQEAAFQRMRRRAPRASSSWLANDAEGTIGLGPGYIYGTEPDPLRALYSSVPDAPPEESS